MKRFSLASVLVALFTLGMTFSATAADRAHTLKIYNWADYIDMDNVLNTFPDWYKAQTGEEVQILYSTFDINESMLTQIEVGHEDYDVICPSEYIIERMLREGLLLPIDTNFGTTPNYTHNVAPFAKEKFQQMSDSLTVSDYAVGYMWGTTGVLYNPKFVDAADLQSWGFILNPKFKNHIFMKDAFRDVYSVLVLYAYRDEIARGEVTRDDLVAHITPERIARVEDILVQAKENIAGWEVDFGKEDMTKGKSWLNVSWSGDAQWAIDEAADGVELRYIVPEEGSNVWFDGWCIPKYAQNRKAASYFINYLCMPENAIRNMEEIGYVSVIASPEILAWADQSADDEDEDSEDSADADHADSETYAPVDLTYFFGEGAMAVHANPVFYPDRSVIERCALMHDCGEQTKDMLDMWSRVKGDNLSSGILIFLGVVAILVIGGIIYSVISKRRKNARPRKRKK